MNPMFAQSLVEYGALSSAIQTLAYTARHWVTDVVPRSWLVVGAILLVVVWRWTRPRHY